MKYRVVPIVDGSGGWMGGWVRWLIVAKKAIDGVETMMMMMAMVVVAVLVLVLVLVVVVMIMMNHNGS
jgi:hypothetical protein